VVEAVGRRNLSRRVIGGNAFWVAGGVAEELRLACCGVVEGPRLAVALPRGRVLLVAEQGQWLCVVCKSS
jgi:hypothetical protein